ncbi:GNAT family N-acetyltransferase [Sulfitobacter delicatus]|uniref:Acetyltransferase (GNAT) domain-containing protein n=1 Tax=Sulfitobacter delicatus TaxID=218672 RepID=A0A1G7U3K7_9RHOB|nr:GNAT family N-acetyltransferase [Sulfitobacter delicatus]SDG42225.1 Acetyltransferase (GNAT) domain-containing protein [Sulfitobacter delicatus]
MSEVLTRAATLRAAQPLDAGAVGEIMTDFARDTNWLPRIHTAAEDIAHADAMIARGWVTVAEQGGQIAGFAACTEGELDALFVAEGARGQGVGSALLNRLKARHPALTCWTFQANAPAIAFYRQHGFAETARGDGSANDEGLPDLTLQWQREAA